MTSLHGETPTVGQRSGSMHAEETWRSPSQTRNTRELQDVTHVQQTEQARQEAVDSPWPTPDTLKSRAKIPFRRPSNVSTTASSGRSSHSSPTHSSSSSITHTDHEREYMEEGYFLLERPADGDPEPTASDWHVTSLASPIPIVKVEMTRNEEEIRMMALEIAEDAKVEEAGIKRPQISKPPTPERDPQPVPSSPRSHINAVQGLNGPSSPLLQPLTDIYEGFISDDDQDDIELGPGHITDAKRKARTIRMKVLSLRADLRMKRKRLQRKEAIKFTADQEFMKFTRENVAGCGTLWQSSKPDYRRNLEHYFAAMQEARDEYGPLEDEYARLTDTLDDLEFDLARAEGRVYKREASANISAVTPDANLVVSESGSSLSLSFGDQERYHPLVLSYFEKIGNLDLAIEKIENMKEEQTDLRNDMEAKHKRGEAFDSDLESFLVQLPTMIFELQTEIDKMEFEVDQLRAQCEQEGLSIHLPTYEGFGSSMNSQENSSHTSTEGNTFKDDVTRQIKQSPSSHNHSMFPLLFPRPDLSRISPPTIVLDPEGKANSLEVLITEFDEHNKSDRINRWLLYDLRTSPLEIALLRQVYLDYLELWNIDIGTLQTDVLDWQQSVLERWTTDGAIKKAEAFRQPQTKEYSSRLSRTSSTKRDHVY